MSNTSTVTPYTHQDSGNILASAIGTTAVVCGGAAVGAAALAVAGTAAAAVGAFKLVRWLAKQTPPDARTLAELEAIDLPPITTLNLHLRETDTLLSTAAKLGYRTLEDTPPSAATGGRTILLQNASGDRLALTQAAGGPLAIHTAGDRSQIHTLVRQHTLEWTLAHLASKGMALQTARLANGELQILAREPNIGQRGGSAEIRAQVRTDGTTDVDIDQCRGNRCETLVAELAQAIGGTVSGLSKKDAYFQLPGEPTRTRVKV